MTIVGTVWAPRGPSPISDGGQQYNGMVTSIAVHPSDGNVIYIGTAGGGVWKTGDSGTNWTPLFDQQRSLAIGEPMAVAIDPNDTDTIYVGTSGRGRVAIQQQAGLFKSTDGGASWLNVGFGYPAGNTGNATRLASDSINAIIVDPANSRTVYLGSSSGVYRSTDAGLNWTLGSNASGDARSLLLDRTSPANARILYAGMSQSGLVRSNDGGRNWTQILSAATPVVAAALATVAGTTLDEVVIDLAPPTSPPAAGGVRVLYVAIAGGGPQGVNFPDPLGLFMSIDQGVTWTQRAASGMPGGLTTYTGYCLAIAVDPASPGNGTTDIIYFGGSKQARSTNSGASFSALNVLHADTHTWAFFGPPAPAATVVYCGNDGGIRRSTDNGVSWSALSTGGLQTGLVYNIDIRPDPTASATVGALQDNRVETTTTGPGWNTVVGGDGWDAVYDGTTPTRLFATTNSNTAPQTRIERSIDDGANWTDVTPWGNTGPEAGYYLSSLAADPSAPGIIYAASNRNLWQTRDGGNTWRTIGPFTSGFITAKVSVAPTNGNNVVVANGSQVSVSTNALAATGVAFTNITRVLPGRPILRAEFDPIDATVIYIVLGGVAGFGPPGHVFRTTIGGTAWTDISPPLDLPYGALALDGSDTPTTLYVGTDFGVQRSVDLGATWYPLDGLHLPKAAVTDLVIGRGSRVLRAATYGRGVFEFVRPVGPAITVNLEKGLDFGTVCGGPEYLTLDVFNVGATDLVINSVQRLMGSGDFSVLATPATPLVIGPGEEIDFTVVFAPTTAGTPEKATIRIISNDPNAPVVDLTALGTGGDAALELALPDDGHFGNVCLGAFVDREFVINNRGPCQLQIFGVSSSSAAFIPPAVTSYPLVVDAGDSIELPIRFQPGGFGAAAATLTITSNDPLSPAMRRVTGNCPAPRLSLSIANTGSFGHVCVGSFRDEPLTLSNSGNCALTISAITSSSPEFIPPQVSAYPITVAAGNSVEVQIRFQPTSFGPKSATLTIASDDPSGPHTLIVSGEAPSGKLAISGTGHFGAVDLGRRAERTLTICNVGECDLHVKRVCFKPDPWKPGCHDCDRCDCDCDHGRKHAHEPEHECNQCCATFKIVSNPFPATVRPGACLGVLITFTPNCGGPKCCELVIESDDPKTPEQTVFVTGRLHRTLSSALKCWAAAELHELLQAGEEC